MVDDRTYKCGKCRDSDGFALPISMAFQPIVDCDTGMPFAYEALVRGCDGQSAAEVLAGVDEATRYTFDQRCRVVAIEQAVRAGLVESGAKLSINFLPGAVYSPAACIQLTLRTARAVGLPLDRLIFEFTENEPMLDTGHVATIVQHYRQMGFGCAIDDFGAGHSGLNRLAVLHPDYVKLDMELVRGIDNDMRRRAIVSGLVAMCRQLGVTLIAEGIETPGERDTLRLLGVRYLQGYLFAHPAFEALPPIVWESGIGGDIALAAA